MIADTLLSRLDNCKPLGVDRWLARCPAHADQRPSLSIRETDDRVLIHCWSGCSASDVVAAVGLQLDALFPPCDTHRGKPQRRPWPAADVLRAVEREALIAAVAACTLGNGGELSADDRERLLLASSRITAAVKESGYA